VKKIAVDTNVVAEMWAEVTYANEVVSLTAEAETAMKQVWSARRQAVIRTIALMVVGPIGISRASHDRLTEAVDFLTALADNPKSVAPPVSPAALIISVYGK
jgi:hypothetical protein